MAVINENTNAGVDFIDLLANCVHDIKNSAALVMNTADSITAPDIEPSIRPQLNSLQTEARRINEGLMQLLGLFKLENDACRVTREIVDCEELLRELQAHSAPLLEARKLELILIVDDGVEGYFDRELVLGILNSAINNAQRYARSVIRIGASIDDGYTVLSVEDDGAGFPLEVLDRSASEPGEANYLSGTSGLGLFFARRIVALHEHRGRRGSVNLSNNEIDGGASFRLSLP